MLCPNHSERASHPFQPSLSWSKRRSIVSEAPWVLALGQAQQGSTKEQWPHWRTQPRRPTSVSGPPFLLPFSSATAGLPAAQQSKASLKRKESMHRTHNELRKIPSVLSPPEVLEKLKWASCFQVVDHHLFVCLFAYSCLYKSDLWETVNYSSIPFNTKCICLNM